MAAKRRGAVFDWPIWTDPIAYLAALAMLAGTRAVSGAHGAAFAVDLVLALLFQLVLFGVIPGRIRHAWRRRRARSGYSPSSGGTVES